MASHQVKTASCELTAVEKDLTEDPIDFTLTGNWSVPEGLKDRFLGRLSRILHASISVQENPVNYSVNIFLSHGDSGPHAGMEEELKGFECILESITKHPRGSALKSLEERLWDTVVSFSYNDAQAVILRLQNSFKHHHNIFVDFINTIFGVDADDIYSEADQLLGGRVIQLSESVQTYDQSTTETSSLIRIASKMTRELEFQERLNGLIRDALFANELFELICKLSFPERTFHTLIAAASTLKTFRHVTFYQKPSASEAGPQPQPLNTASKAAHVEQPANTHANPVSSTTSTRSIPILKSETQQEVALLIQTISRKVLLAKHESAWYSFGFVCTANEQQERRLAGLYAALIQKASSVQDLSHQLHHALVTDALVPLFIAKGHANFFKALPRVKTFLSTPTQQRFTVWRLRQFINTDNVDPPMCLQRDYGFRFCRDREAVVRLKTIYGKILSKMALEALHSACVNGRLFDTAVRAGVTINAEEKRLLKNDYPTTLLGFDSEAGPANRQPLLKKKKKRRRRFRPEVVR